RAATIAGRGVFLDASDGSVARVGDYAADRGDAGRTCARSDARHAGVSRDPGAGEGASRAPSPAPFALARIIATSPAARWRPDGGFYGSAFDRFGRAADHVDHAVRLREHRHMTAFELCDTGVHPFGGGALQFRVYGAIILRDDEPCELGAPRSTRHL